MAPFFSGSGYGSEAIDFALALRTHIDLQIRHHADDINREFVVGLPRPLLTTLVGLYEKSIEFTDSIVVHEYSLTLLSFNLLFTNHFIVKQKKF